mgnify:CR=1 FL=1
MKNLSLAHKKMGRPKGTTKIQPTDATMSSLRGLGQIQCTTKEGAAFFAVSEPTFLKFLDDNPEAREAFEEGKGKGRISLRRHQWRMAENNATMAIWLGKNHLEQTDKILQEHSGDLALTVLTGVPRANG